MTGRYYLGLNNTKNVDFYTIKGVTEEVLDYLGYAGRYSFMKQEMPKEMHPGQSAYINVNGTDVGIIGKLHPNVTKEDVYVLCREFVKDEASLAITFSLLIHCFHFFLNRVQMYCFKRTCQQCDNVFP